MLWQFLSRLSIDYLRKENAFIDTGINKSFEKSVEAIL